MFFTIQGESADDEEGHRDSDPEWNTDEDDAPPFRLGERALNREADQAFILKHGYLPEETVVHQKTSPYDTNQSNTPTIEPGSADHVPSAISKPNQSEIVPGSEAQSTSKHDSVQNPDDVNLTSPSTKGSLSQETQPEGEADEQLLKSSDSGPIVMTAMTVLKTEPSLVPLSTIGDNTSNPDSLLSG